MYNSFLSEHIVCRQKAFLYLLITISDIVLYFFMEASLLRTLRKARFDLGFGTDFYRFGLTSTDLKISKRQLSRFDEGHMRV